MSKKLGLFLSYLGIGLVVFYLAYDANIDGESLLEFFAGYLEAPQKYLFVMSVFITPILLATSIPYFEPMLAVRLKDNVFSHVIKHGFRVSISTALGIWSLFFALGLIWKLVFSFSWDYLFYFVKLLLFLFSAYIMSNMFYFISGKQVLSVLLVDVINFLLLMIIFGLDFYAMNNTMGADIVEILYEIYISLSTVISLGYLFKNSEKEVCISQEK